MGVCDGVCKPAAFMSCAQTHNPFGEHPHAGIVCVCVCLCAHLAVVDLRELQLGVVDVEHGVATREGHVHAGVVDLPGQKPRGNTLVTRAQSIRSEHVWSCRGCGGLEGWAVAHLMTVSSWPLLNWPS